MTGNSNNRVPASRQIAAYAVRWRSADIAEKHLHLARRALLDTYAVAIAGRGEDAAKIALRHAEALGGWGTATVWSSGTTLPAESAAWVNAITAHVLDYDDVMTPMRGHISVALVPPLIALAQETKATMRDYATAYLAGFEVMAKFSRVMALTHYSRGWHSTYSMGVIGAAVSCSVLLGLDETQTMNSIGLAVAQAAGTRENFGTMAKSFQAGQCATAAVRSAMLARAGYDAAATSLDGPYGYMALYAENEPLGPELDALGHTPLEIDATGIDIKKYPCCYATHRGLDAILSLRREHGLTLEDVASVDMLTSAGGLEALICPRPTTGLEGKFSMEYAMAAALADGAIRLSSFDEAQIRRPEIQAYFDKVKTVEAPGPKLPRWSHVTLNLKDGRKLDRRVQVARGDAGDPLTDDELIAKVEDCFRFGGSNADAKTFAVALLGAGSRSMKEVLALCRP